MSSTAVLPVEPPAPAGAARAGWVAGAAFWLIPAVACLLVHHAALSGWFLADDFRWLNRARAFVMGDESLRSLLIEPQAAGSVRPLGERGFFLTLYCLFGLHPAPFRMVVFATHLASLALFASITRRLTGSALAGVIAPLLWVVSLASVTPLAWASEYSEVLCAFCALLAFRFLLQYTESGRTSDWVLQWVAFLVGFGALELMVMYPVVAMAYVVLLQPRLWRRTAWLFVPSVAFTLANRLGAPPAPPAEYRLHLEPLVNLKTLWRYWEWAIGSPGLDPFLRPLASDSLGRFLPGTDQMVGLFVFLVTVAPLAYAAWSAGRGRRLPLLGLAWFIAFLAPLLLLPQHMSEYYIFIPSVGLFLIAGDACAQAVLRPWGWRVAVAVWMAAVIVGNLPVALDHEAWAHRHGERARALVLGVAQAHADHPGKIILIDGIDGDHVWSSMSNGGLRVSGAEAYVTPETGRRFEEHPDWERIDEFILGREDTRRALDEGRAVVYAVGDHSLVEITPSYAARSGGSRP